MTGPIVVFGRAIWDDWQDVESHEPWVNFGGPGANVAVNLALLGFKVRLASAFGRDEYSSRYERHLRRLNIDLSGSTWANTAMPRCRLWRSRPKYDWVDGVDGFASLARVDVGRALSDAAACVVADFPLQLVPRRAQVPMFLAPQLAIARGLTTKAALESAVPEILFLNNKEANLLGSQDDLTELSHAGIACVVTNGDAPTIAYNRGTVWAKRPPTVRVVSPIGGGDAFTAGTVAAILNGESLGDAISIGHSAAAIVVGEDSCQTPKLNWQRIAQGLL